MPISVDFITHIFCLFFFFCVCMFVIFHYATTKAHSPNLEPNVGRVYNADRTRLQAALFVINLSTNNFYFFFFCYNNVYFVLQILIGALYVHAKSHYDVMCVCT